MDYLRLIRRCSYIFLSLLFLIPTFSNASDFASPQRVLTLHGSNTIGAKLGPELAKAYLASIGAQNVKISTTAIENEYRVHGISTKNPSIELEIYIAAHGSSTSFKSLLAEKADIGMASRSIRNQEIDLLSKFGDMKHISKEHIIAIDGLAIVVHPNNPVNSLNKAQIADIFSGRITNWSQVGGENQAITLYARDEASGTWDTFKSLVLGKKQSLAKNAYRFESNDIVSDKITNDINGIGFVGLSSVNKAKVLAVSDHETQPIKPAKLSVATEDYPLSRRLFLYTAKDNNPHVDAFIKWALAKQGQNIVEEFGFISQNITALPFATALGSPEQYKALSQKARRLSVNYRFAPGSAKLDNKGVRDIDRLLTYLSSLPSKPKIWIVGFSDNTGRKTLSSLLSKHRALSVRRKLLFKVENDSEVMGLGSFMPVASNDNSAQKLKNSRVEIWVEASADEMLSNR